MNEPSHQERTIVPPSPEFVYTERDRIIGQIKHIYKNVEREIHPILSQMIEAEADRIINIMTRLESLKLLECCPASTADCKGNVSQNISPSRSITERPQGNCEQILADIYSLDGHFPEISDYLFVQLVRWVECEGLNLQGLVREYRHLELVLTLI